MVATLFTSFDPELKITPAKGKFIAADEKELEAIKNNPNIKVYTEVLEDKALLVTGKRQKMVTIKGVDENFEQLTNIDDILYGDGTFELKMDVIDYGVSWSIRRAWNRN